MITETSLNLTKEKVLIVDDDLSQLDSLSKLLVQYHYDIITAENGIDAIEKARQCNPDLMLLDFSMPGLNGIDTCRALKTLPDTRHIPVVMLTAHADPEIKLQALEAGVNDFLAKPIDPTELVLRVRNMLELKKLDDIKISKDALEEHQAALTKINIELRNALDELKRAQAQIIQQEKMASIGQLSAGIAHEINNPIGFVSSNIKSLDKYVRRLSEYMALQQEFLESQVSHDLLANLRQQRKALKIDFIMNDIKQLISESLDGTDRVKKIIGDLKSFSHSDGAEMHDADINEGIESTLNIVHNEIKYKATVRKELSEIPPIKCIAGHLNQVFMNLFVNAAHAIEHTGEILVKSWADENAVFVSVSDTGSGMPAEVAKRIFEPFFTTKEAGKGTGLGLSIAHDIIKKHNGDIVVNSELGKGTTFTIRLPIAASAESKNNL